MGSPKEGLGSDNKRKKIVNTESDRHTNTTNTHQICVLWPSDPTIREETKTKNKANTASYSEAHLIQVTCINYVLNKIDKHTLCQYTAQKKEDFTFGITTTKNTLSFDYLPAG